MFDAVDLFAGAGGWDIAARDLGLSVLGVEIWSPACQTRDAAGLHTAQGDVRLLNPLDDAFLTPGFIASPPCQSFSTAGKGDGRAVMGLICERIRQGRTDGIDLPEGSALILEPLRWIQTRLAVEQPYRWIAFEQVPTCLPIWEAYAEVLRGYGYSVATGNLQAEQYGVPQTRKRAILVAKKSLYLGSLLSSPTHSRYHNRDPMRLDQGVPKWVSMAEAFGWPTGGGPAFRSDNRPNCATRDADLPAPTVLANGERGTHAKWVMRSSGEIDGKSERNVEVWEAGVLQSFPADYPWQGTKTAQYLQAGNAVPPGLARAVLSTLIGDTYLAAAA